MLKGNGKPYEFHLILNFFSFSECVRLLESTVQDISSNIQSSTPKEVVLSQTKKKLAQLCLQVLYEKFELPLINLNRISRFMNRSRRHAISGQMLARETGTSLMVSDILYSA